MSDYYIALIAMTVFSLLVTLIFVIGNGSLTKTCRLSFVTVSLLMIITSCSEFLGVLWDGVDNSLRVPHIIVKCIELSLTPAIPILYANVLYRIKRKIIPIVLLSMHGLLEVLSPIFSLVFYVDENNIYHHGQFYNIYYVAYISGFIFFLLQIHRYSAKFQAQKSVELFSIMIFVSGGVICQIINSSIRIVWLTNAIGFLMFYTHYTSILSQTDALTGLLTRGYLDKKVARLKKKTVILFFDIDGFKKINDTYGHLYGDDCLVNTATLIRRSFGKSGLCYRYGGDEFCVVMERNVDKIEEYVSEFIDNAREFRDNSDSKFPYVSYGYSIYKPGKDIEKIIKNADTRMYEEKRSRTVLK